MRSKLQIIQCFALCLIYFGMSYLRYLFVHSGVQHILFCVCLFVCCCCCCFVLFLFFFCIVVSNTYCFVFLLCFSSSCVPYDFPFLIIPSVSSNVCLQFLWIFHFWLSLRYPLTFMYDQYKLSSIQLSCLYYIYLLTRFIHQ